jgi:putative transposase
VQSKGHFFSGRYKALVVDGSGDGYLKTVCDYVHLNPVRAKLINPEDRLLAYPWSSLGWYAAAREHRPDWIRVDRLLGDYGIELDSAAGREEFERCMEVRRREQTDEEALQPMRRGWCLGSEQFKRQMLERMGGKLGDHHAGDLHRETAELKGERIVAEELQRLGWKESDLDCQPKSDPGKLALGSRLRRETTLPLKWIAARVKLGSSKSANAKLHLWMRTNAISSGNSGLRTAV